MNRCVRRFVEWDSVAMGLGMVAAPRMLLEKLATGKSGDEFEAYGRTIARELLKPAAGFIGEIDVVTCVEVLRRASTYGRSFNFEFGEGKDSRSHVLVLRHDQGQLWSRYYAGLLDETFRVILGEEAKVTLTDSLCILKMNVH